MATEDSIPSHRCCTKCGQEKPMTDFGNAKKGMYGKKARCKACEAAYMKANQKRINELSLARYYRINAEKRERKKLEKQRRITATEKTCSTCGCVKSIDAFKNNPSSIDGRSFRCKACCNKLNKEYRDANPDRASAYGKKWASKNKDKVRAKYKRWANEPHNKIHLSITSRVGSCVPYGKQNKRTEQIIGYTFKELKAHLEKQFVNGMSWENHGQWHIDHIIPLSKFRITSLDDPELKSAWAMTNLRPLWAKDNLAKSNKILTLL